MPTTPVTTFPATPVGATSSPTATITGGIATTPTGTSTVIPGITPVPEPVPPGHYVVLIVIDANRASYYSLTQLPHIQALMRRGVVYDRAWVGELESSTPNVHVTFGTGTLPRENGFMGFGWAAPQTRQQIDFRTLLANGAIDPVLKSLPIPSVAARLHQFLPGAVSIAASGHKDYAAVGLGGGSATYEIYGRFGKKRFVPTFLPGHSPPPLTGQERHALNIPAPKNRGEEDTWAIKYATEVARHVRPRLLMINLPEADTWGHWLGPDNLAVFRQIMQNIDRGVGRIEATYAQLGILDKTDFIITADHAMMQSRPAHSWHTLWDAAQAVGTHVSRADGEGGAVWLQDPSKAKAVADRLVQMHPSHVEAVFYRSSLEQNYHFLLDSPTQWLVNPSVATALQHLVDTTGGRNGPDVWMLYHENYTVVPRNVSGMWKGTHGGSTWKVQHIPLIMSGPGIRQGIHSKFPARAVDIAPTMERLLGLPAISRDGVALADAFDVPTHVETHQEDGLLPMLSSDVAALQAQSKADDQNYSRWPAPPPPVFRCVMPPVRWGCTTSPVIATDQ